MYSYQFPMEYLECVKRTHERGGYGSTGYQYDWKFEEAQKNLLRTHTTAVSARMLYKLGQQVGKMIGVCMGLSQLKLALITVHLPSLSLFYTLPSSIPISDPSVFSFSVRKSLLLWSGSLSIECFAMRHWTQHTLQSSTRLRVWLLIITSLWETSWECCTSSSRN